jgi:hypothetical protein
VGSVPAGSKCSACSILIVIGAGEVLHILTTHGWRYFGECHGHGFVTLISSCYHAAAAAPQVQIYLGAVIGAVQGHRCA